MKDLLTALVIGVAAACFFGAGLVVGYADSISQTEEITTTSDYAEFNIKFATIYVEKDGNWHLVAKEEEMKE